MGRVLKIVFIEDSIDLATSALLLELHCPDRLDEEQP